MTPQQILALRTDRSFARRGAETYTKENAALLKANGIEPTFPHLRLDPEAEVPGLTGGIEQRGVSALPVLLD